MKIGVLIYLIDRGMAVAEAGRAVEDRGFESLFVSEHTHIPASRLTPWPGGDVLPDYYSRTMDPFVALSGLAVATERLLLGTGVCLVPERDPIVTAKAVASLDLLSGGRFLFGVGAGWNREEMQNHGTDPRRRMKILTERVHAMRAIWTQDEASYHGQYTEFDKIWSWPKPVQNPHPPVLVGGTGPTALERVLDFGDEWMPNQRGDDYRGLGERITELRERAADMGRGRIPVTMFGAPVDGEAVRRFSDIGVDRCIFRVPGTDRDELLTGLDTAARQIGAGD